MSDCDNDRRERVIAALRTVKDPEIPINLYDLGLIYDLKLEGDVARIVMTLTTPNCPVAETMPAMVQKAVESVEGVSRAEVTLTWDPSWTREKMTEEGKLEMEFLGIEWSEPHAGPRTTGLTVNRRRVGDQS